MNNGKIPTFSIPFYLPFGGVVGIAGTGIASLGAGLGPFFSARMPKKIAIVTRIANTRAHPHRFPNLRSHWSVDCEIVAMACLS
jgi:hypothetical protein